MSSIVTNASGAVEIVAFDTRGKEIAAPIVKHFKNASGVDFAGRFHAGVADNIPFGEYQLEAIVPGYYSATRPVIVYEPQVTIIVGLVTGLYESPISQLRIQGHVVGTLPSASHKPFIKLVGLFSSFSAEASIEKDGHFDLGGLSPGTYILLVVADRLPLISRTIALPLVDSSLSIDIRDTGSAVRK